MEQLVGLPSNSLSNHLSLIMIFHRNKRGGIPTNVARLSSAIARKCCTGMPQVVYYHRGAGTEESKVAQTLGGVFGKGIVQVGFS